MRKSPAVSAILAVLVFLNVSEASARPDAALRASSHRSSMAVAPTQPGAPLGRALGVNERDPMKLLATLVPGGRRYQPKLDRRRPRASLRSWLRHRVSAANRRDTRGGRGVRSIIDGGVVYQPPLSALDAPEGLATAADGSLYIADTFHARIVKRSPTGRLSLFAGNGSPDADGDGGHADASAIGLPVTVRVGGDGSVYFGDFLSCAVRKVSPAGVLSTVYDSTDSTCIAVLSFAVDGSGNLYVSELSHDSGVGAGLYRVGSDGSRTRIGASLEGTAPYAADIGVDGRPVSDVRFLASDIVFDAQDRPLIAAAAAGVLRVEPNSTLTRLAGVGNDTRYQAWLAGTWDALLGDSDGRSARSFELAAWRLTPEADGGVLVAGAVAQGGVGLNPNDYSDASLGWKAEEIGRVDASGAWRRIAGAEAPIGMPTTRGFAGDGGPATSALLDLDAGQVVRTSDGSVVFADSLNRRIRKVSAGVIHSIVGTLPPIGSLPGPQGWNEQLGGTNPAELADCRRCFGDPIDLSTGNYFEEETDLEIPARGVALEVTRTYNSQDQQDPGSLGKGWSLNLGAHVDLQGSVARVVQENGSAVVFTLDNGQWKAPSRVLATLTRDASGTWTFVRRQKLVMRFDSSGRLTRKETLDHEGLSFAYSDGRLTTVSDDAGRQLTLSYDNDRVTEIEDPAGRRVQYDYNEAGDLTSVTDPAGKTWSYSYDDDRLLITRTDPLGRVVMRNHYDDQGRVDWQEDAANRRTTFAYDRNPNEPEVSATLATDPAGVKRHSYFVAGVLTSETRAAGTDRAATWSYEYDPATLGVTKITDPDGREETFTYDSHGNQLSSKDALGHEWTFSYSALGDLIEARGPAGSLESSTYDSNGKPLTTELKLTASTAARTTYHYDDPAHPGDLTSVTDPDDRTTTYDYNMAGDLIAETSATGNTTTHLYDQVGRRTQTVLPAGNASGATASEHRWTYEYDARGQMTAATDPLGRRAHFAFDDAGRLTSETNAADETTAYHYAPGGEVDEVTLPDGKKRHLHYDTAGRLERRTDPLSHGVAFTYDQTGLLASRTDALDRVTRYEYNLEGQVIRVDRPAGQRIDQTYDDAGRLATRTLSAVDEQQTFTYDAEGRRIATTDAAGSSTFSYDLAGRLTSHTDGNARTISYAYSRAGDATAITYPGDHTVTRAFDGDHRMTSVTDWEGRTTSFGYDANNNQTKTTFPTASGLVDEASYSRANELTGLAFKRQGGQYASIAYQRDQLSRISTETPSGLYGDSTRSFGYDIRAHLKSVTGSPDRRYDDAGRQLDGDGFANATYDAADQLKSAEIDGATQTYDYDTAGRRTTLQPLNGDPDTFTYDDLDKLTGYQPARVEASISAGWLHGTGLAEDGTARSWGANNFGQLGTGTTTGSTSPVQVVGLNQVVSVQSGAAHSLALKATGSVWAWGANTSSQLGPNQPSEGRSVPTRVEGASNVKAITAGWAHNLALRSDGTVLSWGWNATGQLGDNTTTTRATPQAISGLTGVTRISAGFHWGLALKSDGTVWAWGANDQGQLGDGTTTDRHAPVQVIGLSNIVAISAGATFNAALDANGKIYTWGKNDKGQLGRLTFVGHDPIARQVTGVPAATRIAAGGHHLLALTTNGVYAWGDNSYGQLGDGTTTSRWTPALISGLPTIKAISSGANSFNSFAIAADNHVYAWGMDQTSGSYQAQTQPVDVGSLTFHVPQANVQYIYDADGNRAKRIDNNGTTGYSYDTATSDLPLILADGARSYIYGPDGLPIEQIAADGTIRYLHHDQLGSTRLISDTSGATVGEYTYTPAGRIDSHAGESTPLGYAGEYRDADTGLIYLRARYYDPATSQFLTIDPIADETLEPYGYVGNDPVNHIDPTGLSGMPKGLGAGNYGWAGPGAGRGGLGGLGGPPPRGSGGFTPPPQSNNTIPWRVAKHRADCNVRLDANGKIIVPKQPTTTRVGDPKQELARAEGEVARQRKNYKPRHQGEATNPQSAAVKAVQNALKAIDRALDGLDGL